MRNSECGNHYLGSFRTHHSQFTIPESPKHCMGPLFMMLLLVAGWGAFAYSARRRWKLLRVGAPENRFHRPAERLRRTWTYAIAQLRMRRYPLAGAAHMLIFSGFVVLLLRTLILWGRGFDESFNFRLFGPDQLLGRIYSVLKDVFALLVILGAMVFVYYRVVKRLGRMTLSTEGLSSSESSSS